MSLGAAGPGIVSCDDPSKPAKCTADFVPGNEKAAQFQILVQANIGPDGGYTGVGSEVFLGGLTYNSRACDDEVVLDTLGAILKNGNPASVALCLKSIDTGGQVQHGVVLDLVPNPATQLFDATNYTGPVIALNVHCSAAGTFKLTLTAFVDTVNAFGAHYRDSNGNFVEVEVVGEQQLDTDGDTTTETVAVADVLDINCVIAAAPTPLPCPVGGCKMSLQASGPGIQSCDDASSVATKCTAFFAGSPAASPEFTPTIATSTCS